VTAWPTVIDAGPRPKVTVALAGGGVHKLRRAQVSAYLVPTVGANEVATANRNRFTALRQFEIRGCAAGANG
jgi:hypothetical protein